MSGRILYMAPDLEHPSGGVAAIYAHVESLRAAGRDAFVAHVNPGHAHVWAEIEVPILAFNDGLRIFPEDILTIPEGCLFPELARMERVRKIAFVQSCLYAFDHPGGASAWRSIHFDGALCCSALTRGFAVEVLGIPLAWTVPNAVDANRFKPGAKKPRIAFMPRKNPGEIAFLRSSLGLKRPEYASVPWVPVQGLGAQGVAEVLGESAIFLSTCYYEGFNLPPLEAMACGALVVGFHGYGGLEYVEASNGLWCAQGDLLDCLGKLERALDLVHGQDAESAAELAAFRLSGMETAGRYSRQARDAALRSAWSAILGETA